MQSMGNNICICARVEIAAGQVVEMQDCYYVVEIQTQYACSYWTPSPAEHPTLPPITPFPTIAGSGEDIAGWIGWIIEFGLAIEILFLCIPICCCILYCIGAYMCYRNNLKYKDRKMHQYHSINQVGVNQDQIQQTAN